MRLLTLTQVSRALNIPYRALKRDVMGILPVAYAQTGGYKHGLYTLDQFEILINRPTRQRSASHMVALT